MKLMKTLPQRQGSCCFEDGGARMLGGQEVASLQSEAYPPNDWVQKAYDT